MSRLLDIATDPKQYDQPDVQFSGVKGLEDPHRRHFLQYIESIHPHWKNENVLDVGAGSGWFMRYLIDGGANNVVGFDPSIHNVELANNHFGVDVIQSTLQDSEFHTDHYFDIAIAIYVLTHVQDLDQAFSVIAQNLKPGGRFITIVADPEYAKRIDPSEEKEIEYMDNDPYHTFIIRAVRKTGTIADIVRDPQAYIDAAKQNNMYLESLVEMKSSDILAEAYEKHRELQKQNVTNALMLVFRKN